MTNKFAWASMSEHGTKNGKKGDQTGKEVKIGDYYNFGQDLVIRFRSVTKGRECGKIAKIIAENDAFGYGQTDRSSSFNAFKKIGWNIENIEKLKGQYNLDCSMLATICINCTFKKEILGIDTYTGNIVPRCRKLKDKFSIITKNSAEKSFHKGDMPIKEGKHIIINV